MAISAKNYDLAVKLQGEDDANYKNFGCHLGYENLMHQGTRDLAGTPCMAITDTGENGKRLKSKKFDNGSITYVYSPTATDGRKIIQDAFDDEELDVKLTIKLTMDDKGTGTSGTYVERDVLITAIEVVDDDEQYVEKVSMEFLNAPRKTDRVA